MAGVSKMIEIVGKPTSRTAKPIIMTFYDYLKYYPYTTKFYVREDTSETESLEIINAVCGVTECVLGKYTIGYKPYIFPNFREHIEQIRPVVMGTFKWTIKYRLDGTYQLRTHTIPGRHFELTLPHSKQPNPQHPLWTKFLDTFKRVCVSEEGNPIPQYVQLGITASNWPPKGAKKRR
jgi:hypothetical protein